MLTVSRKLQTECKKANLDIQERAMADLMVLGWSDQDAFIAAGFNKPMLNDDYNRQQMLSMTTDTDFNKYIESRRKALKKGIMKQYTETPDEVGGTDREKIRLMSKEEILQEALQSALSLPVNDKNRVEILMKYADLAQMKKEEIKEEDTTIHYYLPLSCKQCSLYKAHKAKNRGV